MGIETGIQWTDATWNPWRGCTMISPGCANCYMFSEQRRYGKDPAIVTRTKTWGDPIKWNKRATAEGVQKRIFTCSWSDWFHRDADAWRPEAWNIVRDTPNLIYQILTKRAGDIADRLPTDWGAGYPNVWLGVSVEDQKRADERIPLLIRAPAAVRFLSCEPLLGPIEFSDVSNRSDAVQHLGKRALGGINWMIVGGESGRGARSLHLDWVRSLRDQCQAASVPVFIKQLGKHVRHIVAGGQLQSWFLNDLKGGDMSEWPEDLRVREFPTTKGAP